MKDIVLSVNNLSKKYKNNKGIDNINLNLAKGEIYALIGENGSGKSTLMKVLIGIINKDVGTISILNSISKKELIYNRKLIGSVIEEASFYGEMTAFENLKYVVIARGLAIDDSGICDILNTVGLTPLNKTKFSSLSIGMKQRLALASAIIGKPKILILDEPTNGFDPKGILSFRELVKDLSEHKGVTILIASHILSEISSIATKYGFLKDGKLINEISSEDLKKVSKSYIRLKVDNVNLTSILLENKFSESAYTVLPDESIHLYDGIDDIHSISKLLIENNISIYNIELRNNTLEDYFLKLINREDL